MRRDIETRLRQLEKLAQVDMNLLLTFPDGNQTKMLGHASHFFRMVDLLLDPDVFKATRAAGAHHMAELDLDALRRTISIEGDSAQLFALLQALAQGPAEPVRAGEERRA